VNIASNPRGSLFALGLILAGALLFLDNLGILPVDNIGAYWPLALVVYGFGIVYHRRTPSALIWSAALIIAGVLLVLGNLHVLPVTVGALWPLLLIAIGAEMLVDRPRWDAASWGKFDRLRERRGHWRRRAFAGGDFTGSGYAGWPASQGEAKGPRLNEVAVFFSIKRRIETSFQSGELVSVFGSIELDLSGAAIEPALPDQNGGRAERLAVVEASAVFGSVEITVPRSWRIVKEGAGVFGSYEDKTLPARPEPGVEIATLVLRGGAVFGSVTVRN
jgi:hypothetical protein